MDKVLFVANSEWYLRNFRVSTLKKFSKEYETYCAFPNNGGGCKGIDDCSVKCESFSMNPSGKNPFQEVVSILSMLRCFFKIKPDLVFSFNPKTNLYSLICCFFIRSPCVVNVSGVGESSQLKGVVGKLYRFLCKILYNRAKFIFFQNEYDRDCFKRNGWINNVEHFVLPGSGVDLLKFKPGTPHGKCTKFLMASRLIRAKGIEEYVGAAKEINKRNLGIKFFLAGVPDASSRSVDDNIIESAVKSGAIEYLGNVCDMPGLLASMDCVVLPSYYPEGTPKVLIEAAATGNIIITTDTPGCRALVMENINGYLVKPKSVYSLVEAIIEINSLSENQVSEMKVMSRDLAEKKYDEVLVIEKYLWVARSYL